MSKINKIADIDTNVVGSLAKQDIRTTADLWRRIGVDYDRGLQAVANDTGVAPDQLIDILAHGAVHEQESGQDNRHWFIYLLLLLLVIWLGWRIFAALSTAPTLHKLATNQVVVTEDLPAYQILGEQDLMLQRLPATTGGFPDPMDLVGYYLLQPIAAGEPLQQEHVSSVKLPADALLGSAIITLPFDTVKVNPNLAQGDELILLLAPGSTESGDMRPVEAAVTILNVAREEDTVMLTMAIKKDQLEPLRKMMGVSEFFIFQQAP